MERTELAAQSAAALSDYQATTDADEVDLKLIVALLGRLCDDPQYSLQSTEPGSAALGAMLVFLPGQLHQLWSLGWPCLMADRRVGACLALPPPVASDCCIIASRHRFRASGMCQFPLGGSAMRRCDAPDET